MVIEIYRKYYHWKIPFAYKPRLFTKKNGTHFIFSGELNLHQNVTVTVTFDFLHGTLTQGDIDLDIWLSNCIICIRKNHTYNVLVREYEYLRSSMPCLKCLGNVFTFDDS